MSERAVQVVTEVAPLDRPFDYRVTEKTADVALGDRVRVQLQQRSVRGWVVGEAESEGELKPLTKWLGFGPPPSMLAILAWAGERWYGPLSRFLLASSPRHIVSSLPPAPTKSPLAATVLGGARHRPPGVLELSPTTDPLGLILDAYQATREREGSLLVLVPTEGWANRLRGRLEQRGCDVASGEAQWDRMRAGWPVVVGSRGAALAPVPLVAGAVVLDADDEAFRSDRAPTWNAVTMLRERCRRDGAPLWCTSMIPSPALLGRGDYSTEDGVEAGWPRIVVADRRLADPHDGALSRVALDAAHRALRGSEPVAVVVVLQRLGTGRLFACPQCGELARCAVCAGAEVASEGGLACRDVHEPRANFCRSCGATNLRPVRVGVTTMARDVGSQLGQPVTELTATSASATPATPPHRVVVGTEAVWRHVRRAAAVVFLDFDQYLLAPRASARREAVIAVGKAGRLVGPRREGRGEVVLQTRRGEDPVVSALSEGRMGHLVDDDRATARLLGLAPYGAIAAVSGEGAAAFVERLGERGVAVHATSSGFEVRARDHATLSAALRDVPRPPGRLRVAVE